LSVVRHYLVGAHTVQKTTPDLARAWRRCIGRGYKGAWLEIVPERRNSGDCCVALLPERPWRVSGRARSTLYTTGLTPTHFYYPPLCARKRSWLKIASLRRSEVVFAKALRPSHEVYLEAAHLLYYSLQSAYHRVINDSHSALACAQVCSWRHDAAVECC
jgi:hypothetical protein